MDLAGHSLEDLILTAIKAEVEAKAIYLSIADGVKNAYLKGRLHFLAEEEEKHRSYLDGLYRSQFQGKVPELPVVGVVPLPEVALPHEQVPISILFEQAMAAEKAAAEFYASMAKLFEEGHEARDMLTYFSRMEMGHYSILETEKDAATAYEEFDEMWPMMHSGP